MVVRDVRRTDPRLPIRVRTAVAVRVEHHRRVRRRLGDDDAAERGRPEELADGARLGDVDLHVEVDIEVPDAQARLREGVRALAGGALARQMGGLSRDVQQLTHFLG